MSQDRGLDMADKLDGLKAYASLPGGVGSCGRLFEAFGIVVQLSQSLRV